MAACTIANVKAHSVVRRILQNFGELFLLDGRAVSQGVARLHLLLSAQVLEGKELSRAPALFF